jgi:hypothetical protein
LKVEAAVVDRPRAVRFHVHAVADVVEEMLERDVAGEQVQVAHPDDRHVRPTLGAHARRRFRADRRCGIARALETDEHPVADHVGADAFGALVIVADRRETARQRVVDLDRDLLRAVAQFAALTGIEKTRAAEVGFPAHDAVELGGMSARFVDLQRDLRAAEDDVHRPARTLRSAQQLVSLLADPRGVLTQLCEFDRLPPAAEVQTAVAGPHPDLRVAVADGQRRDRAPALHDRLPDPRTDRRGELFLGMPEIDPRASDRDARHHVQRLLGGEQQRDAFADRDRRGIAFDRRRKFIDVRGGRGTPHAATADRGAGPGDRDRAGRGCVEAGSVEGGAGGESPRAVDERAHAVADAAVVIERRDLAVAHFDALRADALETDVGIRGAAACRGIEHPLGFCPKLHACHLARKNKRPPLTRGPRVLV